MSPSVYQASKALFEQAVDLPPDRRACWLQSQDASEEVRAEVARLLALHTRAGESFLDREAAEVYDALRISASTALLKSGDELNLRYRIRRLLGAGGMGEVYEAFDEHLHQPAALKFLRPECSSESESLERFRREVVLAREISHPNVCRIYEFGQVNSPLGTRTFFTMELLSGETLGQRIHRPEPIEHEEAQAIVCQMLSGLQAVHALGIVHRDLKPANIMLVPNAGGHRVVLMDFGLAVRFDQSTLTETGKVLGTLDYMAPEQMEGGETGPWTDLYALGLIMFEMLTAEKPFAADTAVAGALQRLKGGPLRPVAESREFPPAWMNTILACLERDPKRRPASTVQVAHLLAGGVAPRRIQTRRRWMIGSACVSLGAAAAYRWWPHARTWDPEAIRAAKRGDEFAKRRTLDDLRQAISEFDLAVRREPDFGPAWTGLADAWSALSNFGFAEPLPSLDKAREAAQRAVALQPSSAKAMGALGYVISIDLRRWRDAEPYFNTAVSLDRKDPTVQLWYGAHLGRLGRFSEALEHLQTGLDSDPSSFTLNAQVAQTFLYFRNKEKYLTQARELVRLQPREPVAYLTLAYALEQMDAVPEARKAFEEAKRLNPGDGSSLLTLEAVLLSREGKKEVALRIAKQLGARTSSLAALVFLCGKLGLYEDALAAIEDAVKRGDSSVLMLAVNPRFDAVRHLPGFTSLLRQVGLDVNDQRR